MASSLLPAASSEVIIMPISIVSATENPIDVIGTAAGTSYGRPLDEPYEKRLKRVKHCVTNGHLSVLEQAVVTFRCECSRACSHQLVRHRIASYCQKSQRYTKLSDWDRDDDWYVTPAAFKDDRNYHAMMLECALDYQNAIDKGIKPEDARYLLPEATKTEITCTFNVRSLFNFLDLRTDSHAQWEIRDLAFELVEAVAGISDQWRELMEMWNLKK